MIFDNEIDDFKEKLVLMYKNSKYFEVVTGNVQKTRLFLKYFYISGRKAFPPGNNREQD